MLTIEMLRQNTQLSGLAKEQLDAIVEMSRNDENTVIGTKIGALHGQYDADILNVTGIHKNDGEKSYDYAKRVLADYKAKSDSVKGLEKQVTDLQAKLEKNVGDETLKQQLKDSKAQVSQLQAQLQAKDTELGNKAKEYDKAIKDTHIDYAFQSAISGIKFKAGITEPIQKMLLNAAKDEVMAKGTPDLIDNGNGGKSVVFRDQAGNIINNPKNNLNPYTIRELVMETSLKDVIDDCVRQNGGGTTNKVVRNTSGNAIDMSGVKTQLEADKAIEAHLLANGLTRDSQEFAEQSMQLRNENNVADLPLR